MSERKVVGVMVRLECENCHGNRRVPGGQRTYGETVDCPVCHGRGTVEGMEPWPPAAPEAARSLSAEDVVDRLAAIEHERWSGWMRYLFTKGKHRPSGGFEIEAASVVHWHRQMEMPYENLTENEKESDRKEVRKTLAALKGLKQC